jgi:hypothetical protein
VQRLLHLNRGLPGSAVYDLSTVRQPEVRGEISPRIKCSSLRFKCNSLLHLNRGLPGSAVYDLSTVRQLGRSLRELLDVVEDLQKREVALLSLEEKLDTSSAAGELVFHVFGALAQFERRLIAERTRDGMNAARAKGSRPGRPPLNPEKLEAAPVTGQGRHVAHQGRPPNRARTLNALPRNPSAGSLPELLAYVLEQILR